MRTLITATSYEVHLYRISYVDLLCSIATEVQEASCESQAASSRLDDQKEK